MKNRRPEDAVKGEGSYSATRDYARRTEDFMKRNSDDAIRDMGEAAADALDGAEGESLRRAEAEGKLRGKSTNPADRISR